MIKVADFSAELCRNDFAGVPKQPVADTNVIVRGIGELLPKLIVRSGQEQVVEMENGPAVFATAARICVRPAPCCNSNAARMLNNMD